MASTNNLLNPQVLKDTVGWEIGNTEIQGLSEVFNI